MRRSPPNAVLIISELQVLGAIEHCQHNEGKHIICMDEWIDEYIVFFKILSFFSSLVV